MTKYLLSLCLLLALLPAAHAQIGFNSPVGITPRQDAEIYTRNGFLVQQKYRLTTADPAANVVTMSCATAPTTLTAQAGTLLDPGGTGNYPASQTCTQIIQASTASGLLGFELVFEDLDTENNQDRIFITDANNTSTTFSGALRATSVVFVFGSRFTVRFESDNDAVVGRGFRLRWREVYYDFLSAITPPTVFGNSFQFDVNKGSLMAGRVVSGGIQLAGTFSTALGFNNMATGGFAVALGTANEASKTGTVAIGTQNIASGDYSIALGRSLNTNNQTGVFMIGDSRNLVTLASQPNQFIASFSNGYRLISNNTFPQTGVEVLPGGTSWATLSDSTRKERFLPINGPDLLHKIGGMKLTTWNYKGQRDRRHYGPMAQEFFALFGQDALGPIGCDTLITTQDMEGLTLSAVQALVRENEQLKTRLNALENENARLSAETQRVASLQAETNNRLHLLERAMLTRRERVSLQKLKP